MQTEQVNSESDDSGDALAERGWEIYDIFHLNPKFRSFNNF